MHVELPAGLQNKQLSEYFMREEELLPRKICPTETAVSLGGWRRGYMYCNYLDCRHLNKYRVV